MKTARTLISLFLTIALVAPAASPIAAFANTPPAAPPHESVSTKSAVGEIDGDTDFVPGEVLVTFEQSASKSRRDAAIEKVRGRSAEAAGKSKARIARVEIGSGQNVSDAIKELKKQPGVVSAQPNYVKRLASIPNDPEFSNLWGLNNTGQSFNGVAGRVDADIDAPEAWTVTQGSADIVVAVLDTGTDLLHPDLKNNLWVNTGEIPGNGIDDDGNGYVDDVHGWNTVNNSQHVHDDNGHGTHVAGTIAAEASNGIGIAGVAPKVRIMTLKTMNGSGVGSTSSVTAALEYAKANGADVISGSFGSERDFDSAEYTTLKEMSVPLVFAAGNDGNNNDAEPFYPASYDLPNIIAVGASDNRDERAVFNEAKSSNYGAQTVDLMAPGSYIRSTIPSALAETVAFQDGADNLNVWTASTTKPADSSPWTNYTSTYKSSPASLGVLSTKANQNDSIALKQGINLGNAVTAKFTADARYYLTGADYAWVYGSSDQSPTPRRIAEFMGSTANAWEPVSVDLSQFAGHTGFKLQFTLMNGGGTSGGHIRLDNLKVITSTAGSYSKAYDWMSGTSMATPHVAGAAALLLSMDSNMTPAQVKSTLLNSVDKKSALTGKCLSGGRLNVNSAVQTMVEPPAYGSITGTVACQATGSKLSNVTVSIPGEGLSAKTNTSGSYTIAGVPEGSYSLEFARSGYAQTKVDGVVVPGEAVVTADVALSPVAATTLTLNAPAMRWDGSSKLEGYLNEADGGAPVVGKQIIVERSLDGGATWRSLTTRTTSDVGRWYYTYNPTTSYERSQEIRVRFVGDGEFEGAGAQADLTVKATLWRPTLSVKSPTRNKSFTIKGYTAPRFKPGVKPVRADFYKKTSSGSWKYIKYVNLTTSYYSSSKTKLTAKTTLPTSGSYRVRLRYDGAKTYRGYELDRTYSSYLYFTVKK